MCNVGRRPRGERVVDDIRLKERDGAVDTSGGWLILTSEVYASPLSCSKHLLRVVKSRSN